MLIMNKLVYINQDKYEPSVYNLKSSKSINSFINSIRGESLLRKLIKINDEQIIFGIEGPIVLENGNFWYISAEVKNGKWGKHHILISPNLRNIIKRGKSFIRLDSGCLSGMLGDVTCDCLQQLRIAQEIALMKGGIIIHIPDQDGRGWQESKMAHQRIMHETNLNTIEIAVKFYGNKDLIDIRTFDESALILKALGFPENYKFELGTRNPIKINALSKAGFDVSTRPIEVKEKLSSLTKNLKAKDKFFGNQTKEK